MHVCKLQWCVHFSGCMELCLHVHEGLSVPSCNCTELHIHVLQLVCWIFCCIYVVSMHCGHKLVVQCPEFLSINAGNYSNMCQWQISHDTTIWYQPICTGALQIWGLVTWVNGICWPSEIWYDGLNSNSFAFDLLYFGCSLIVPTCSLVLCSLVYHHCANLLPCVVLPCLSSFNWFSFPPPVSFTPITYVW